MYIRKYHESVDVQYIMSDKDTALTLKCLYFNFLHFFDLKKQKFNYLTFSSVLECLGKKTLDIKKKKVLGLEEIQ